MIEVIEFRSTTTLSRIDRKPEVVIATEGWTLRVRIYHQWWYHRNFMIEQKLGKAMLFVDLRHTPAVGSIELDDDRVFIFDAYLVDAIFVAI
jgi:hypothetical protein